MRVVRAFVLAPLLAVGLGGQAAAQVTDPPVIIDAYERARGQRDLDTALSHFADDAVVRLVERGTVSFSGKTEIRRFLQNVGIRTPPLVTSNRHVVGNTVTWNERDQGQLQSAIELTVEAVVQDGKIKSLVYRVAAPPAAEAKSVDGPARIPAAAGLAVVLGLGLMLLTIASLAPRRRAIPSTLRGKLLSELGNFRPAHR